MSVHSPFQSASTAGQGTYGQSQSYGPFTTGKQSQSYGPFTTGQQATPQDLWGDIGSAFGSPQQAAKTVQQAGQAIDTISRFMSMFSASPGGQQPGMSGQYGQQPSQPSQQQATPQDIWGDIGSAFGSAGRAVASSAPDIAQAAKTIGPFLPIALALLSASPGGQQPGMSGQYGQQPSQPSQQQATPQDLWGDIGSAFGSPQQAAQTVQQVGQAVKTISDIFAMLSASPGGQQPGMSGQYGQQPSQPSQQQATPQDLWGDIGSAFGSPQQAAKTVQQAGQAIDTISRFMSMFSASPGGQQPGMSGQYGQQPSQQPSQPSQPSQQQATPQDIWGGIGSAFGSPQLQQISDPVKTISDIFAMLSASPGGQQPGMSGQYGQQPSQPSQPSQQQATPQDLWGDIGSAFGSPQQAAKTVQQAGQAIDTISRFMSMFSASPGGQQPGMSGQYGRQY